MSWFRTNKRVTACEVRLDELKEALTQSNEAVRELAKAALNLVDKQLNQKTNIERDLDELKRQMDITMRAQCATYSAALERVQCMLEFEKRTK